ncbi:hypothetical protein Ccrd_018483 [Cynara cardunculus var. scolymus]|uniref:Secreted protein n=1 Tax=Cynara cardunculus var. scolymus TaxID=59895 RepID=A0A103Y642_CYNCS|nr:hypothetical protein Ccrd_018483 [Cynara cardunculus var. scolymus]
MANCWVFFVFLFLLWDQHFERNVSWGGALDHHHGFKTLENPTAASGEPSSWVISSLRMCGVISCSFS